jgi:hypothetical protein
LIFNEKDNLPPRATSNSTKQKNLILAILIFCLVTIFSQAGRAAPPDYPNGTLTCTTSFVSVEMPSINFDICDFTFTVEVTISHEYATSHEPEYATFKSANANLSTGKLAYIAEEKAKLFTIGATEATALENYRSAWRQKVDELRQLDSLRQSGSKVSQSQYETALQQHATAQTQYGQYTEGLKQARQTAIQSLLTLNAAVTTSLAPDANHKTVNGIMLNMLANKGEFASTDLTTLTAIADQCPLEGGDAVYEARAVVAYLTGQEFDDYQLCDSGERQQRAKRQNTTEAAKDIAIYPNPTTGDVFFTVPGEILVRVFNELGQIKLEKAVTDGRISLAQLQPGVYRLQLFREGQMLTTQSVVLLNH